MPGCESIMSDIQSHKERDSEIHTEHFNKTKECFPPKENGSITFKLKYTEVIAQQYNLYVQGKYIHIYKKRI